MPFDESSYGYGGGGGGTVTVQGISDEELGLTGAGSYAPISADIGSVSAPVLQEFQAQTPYIQNAMSQIGNYETIVPQDVSSQISSLSQSLLTQQSTIQNQFSNVSTLQSSVNASAQSYQSGYSSISPQINSAINAYNSYAAGYKQAYANYAKTKNTNYLGKELNPFYLEIPNFSASWFKTQMTNSQNTINTLNSQLKSLQDNYNSNLNTYNAGANDLKNSISTYNNNYSTYQDALGTAQSAINASKGGTGGSTPGNGGGPGGVADGKGSGIGGGTGGGGSGSGNTVQVAPVNPPAPTPPPPPNPEKMPDGQTEKESSEEQPEPVNAENPAEDFQDALFATRGSRGNGGGGSQTLTAGQNQQKPTSLNDQQVLGAPTGAGSLTTRTIAGPDNDYKMSKATMLGL